MGVLDATVNYGYFNTDMKSGQELPLFAGATSKQRLFAGLVFLIIISGFAMGWLMGRFHWTPWPFACGFKQRYGLPCLTCGMTTAVVAFSQGHIIHSFYVQPAAAIFCAIAIVMAFFAFIIAGFGIYSPRLERHLLTIKIRYIIAALGLILVTGWIVTLTRALSEQGRL